MKKTLSLLLAVLILMSLPVCSSADNDSDDAITLPLPEVGLTLSIPADLFMGEGPAGGIVEVLIAEEMGYQSGVYLTQLIYEPNPDVFEPENYAPYLTFLCLKEGYDQSITNDPDIQSMIPGGMIYEIQTVGPYTHYVAIGTDRFPAGFSQANVSEYQSFLNLAEDIVYNGVYTEPEDPSAESIGNTVSFQTTDLNGNPVNSADLFAANEITMLNIWETGCGPCRGELPELAQMHARLQSLGCGIVGLLWDSDSPENISAAKTLLQDAGVTYPSICCPDNFDDLFPIDGFPTTYFIGRNGQILGTPVSGALVDKYEPAIQALLSGSAESDTQVPASSPFNVQAGVMKTSGKAAPASADSVYRIICVDEDGNPVAGATVQFCSEDMCRMDKTDADGIAEFDSAPGRYVIHLLKPPAGYAKDSTEYEAPSVCGDVTIVLKAA